MDEPLILTPIPSLVSLLLHHEQAKGSPLTQEEVEEIRDNAACVALPASGRKAVDEERGYEDIAPEFAWQHWQQVRGQLGQED